MDEHTRSAEDNLVREAVLLDKGLNLVALGAGLEPDAVRLLGLVARRGEERLEHRDADLGRDDERERGLVELGEVGLGVSACRWWGPIGGGRAQCGANPGDRASEPYARFRRSHGLDAR